MSRTRENLFNLGLFLIALAICIIPATAGGAPGNIKLYVIPPSNANACIDGVCQVTGISSSGGMASFEGLTGDSHHELTVNLEGYLPYTENVYVVPGETKVVTVTMQPIKVTQVPPMTKAGIPEFLGIIALVICGVIHLFRSNK